MKDKGQLVRASENFAGPVDFETPRPDWPVQFLTSPSIIFIIIIVIFFMYIAITIIARFKNNATL